MPPLRMILLCKALQLQAAFDSMEIEDDGIKIENEETMKTSSEFEEKQEKRNRILIFKTHFFSRSSFEICKVLNTQHVFSKQQKLVIVKGNLGTSKSHNSS